MKKQQQQTKNKGGRPAIFEEPSKMFGMKISEAELQAIDKLGERFRCNTRSPMVRILLALGSEVLYDDDFINYCLRYKFTPAQMFAHIFRVWRDELQRFAPQLDKSTHRFEDVLKLLE